MLRNVLTQVQKATMASARKGSNDRTARGKQTKLDTFAVKDGRPPKVTKPRVERERPPRPHAHQPPAPAPRAQKCLQYSEVKGDLFSCPDSASLAHCVSEDLHMGKGVATEFKKRFRGVDALKEQGMSVYKVKGPLMQ